MNRAAPVALFLVALAVRLAASAAVDFPATQPSAYYVDVASHFVEGRGLVADGIWSFATPPHIAPKPAFDLWLPMASLAMIPALVVLGPDFASAQIAHSVLGAALAPIAWWIATDGARRNRVSRRRQAWVGCTAGLVVAVLGPLVVSAMAPDSTTPFAVFVTAAVVMAPRALGEGAAHPSIGAAAVLGLLLGLAYLSRQEAVYVAVVYLALAILVARRRPRGGGSSYLRAALGPVVVVGALTVVPWLLRNALTFGSAFAGQAVENAFLTKPADVFAWSHRPTAAAYFAQGVDTLTSNIVTAVAHDFVAGILLPAAPVSAVGIGGLLALRSSRALADLSPLRLLLAAGALTFITTSVVFPVATLAGTYSHSVGPTLAALAVMAALGADAAIARAATFRRWSRSNEWLAPLALAAVTIPLTVFQVAVVAQGGRSAEVAVRQAVVSIDRGSGVMAVSNRPVWLAYAADRPVVALPDEAPANVWALAQQYGAPLVVIFDTHGQYPAVMADTACFTPLHGAAGEPGQYLVKETCPEAGTSTVPSGASWGVRTP